MYDNDNKVTKNLPKGIKTFISMSIMLLFPVSGLFAQGQKDMTAEEMEEEIINNCEKRADQLAQAYKLEDWQVFYVDSTLKHDYLEMNRQMRQMHQMQISNQNLYTRVQDEWMEKVDQSFRRIFDDNQWTLYWKREGQNAAKARQKRSEQEQAATDGKKK